MLENHLNPKPERHPAVNLIIIIAVAAIGFLAIGPLIGYFVALPFYPGTGEELLNNLQDITNHPEVKTPFFIIQGCATFIGLIVLPAMFMSQSKSSVFDFFKHHRFEWIPVAITILVVIVFMAVNSVFIEWNSKFHFPEFMPDVFKNFENWAREKEDTASEVTTFLTQFESPAELFIALVVIAVLPAIGEEIVFRGLIQSELLRATHRVHLSIWLSAILFSAIHIQFFGFVPRLLLGALFGYLYYWSGNLALAILAHFVNNATSVIALYYYQQGALDIDPESTESVPANVDVISTLLTIGLLYYFYKYFEHRKPAISNRDFFPE